MLEQEFESFRSLVQPHHRIVLTTHINPDGDGLGSECALASYFLQKGKSAWIFNHSATPPNYAFLNECFPISQFDKEKHSSIVLDADLIVVVDTNHPDRLVSMTSSVLQSRAKKICIDHHLDPASFADLYLLDETSTATGEIVYRILHATDPSAITKPIAVSLYTAIMTDTGSFRFPKTDPETHRITAHLLEQGADPVEIYQQVYERGSSNRVRLLGKVLANINVVHNGKVAYLVLTKDMMRETGTSEVDSDSFVPYALTIQGVEIGLMFTELEDGIKVNFRSKGDIWVNRLANEFGGNGHKNAAGARIQGTTLKEVLPKVVDRSQHYLSR